MFDFLKKEKTEIVVSEKETLVKKETTSDTIYIYRVIVGSFKNMENAQLLSDTIPFSDILIINDEWYRVSKSYHFDKKDAQTERDLLGEDVWVLKDFILLEK